MLECLPSNQEPLVSITSNCSSAHTKDKLVEVYYIVYVLLLSFVLKKN